MVVLIIRVNTNPRSDFTKTIEKTLIDTIGKKGFYASMNFILDPEYKMKLNGKKTKRMIIVKDEYEAIKKIEKIKDEHVLIIYDCRFYKEYEDIMILFTDTLGEIKPKKNTIIAIVNKDFHSSDVYLKIKENQSVMFIATSRPDLFECIADTARSIAQFNALKKTKKLKNELRNNLNNDLTDIVNQSKEIIDIL